MRILAAIITSILALQSSWGFAAAEQPSLAGVWEGTVGNQPVRACFNEPGVRDGFGAYYYKAHLQPIYLRPLENEPGTYVEGYPWEKQIPQWILDKVTEDKITGRWSKDRHELSFRLVRLPGLTLKEDETPCSSSLFHAPRLRGIHLVSQPASKDGFRYTRLVFEYPDHTELDVETFALPGRTPAVLRLNANLRKPLEGNPPEWHQCELTAAASNSNGGLSDRTELRMVTRRWLNAVRFVEAYCGGAHPDSWYTPHTYDLQTGREVDLSKWLNGRVGTPTFRRLFFANGGRDDHDCKDFVEQSVRAFALDIELKKNGLAFKPNDLPHVVQACGDESFISFAKLAPYLTPEGRKNIAALAAEVAAKR